jgi:hypothetical protein
MKLLTYWINALKYKWVFPSYFYNYRIIIAELTCEKSLFINFLLWYLGCFNIEKPEYEDVKFIAVIKQALLLFTIKLIIWVPIFLRFECILLKGKKDKDSILISNRRTRNYQFILEYEDFEFILRSYKFWVKYLEIIRNYERAFLLYLITDYFNL